MCISIMKMNIGEIMGRFHELKDPDKIAFKEKKFGVVANNSLGIYHQDLKKIAQEIGYDNELALQLFNSGIYEGRLLCSKIFDPRKVTETLMEEWVKTFENWEICDSFSMGIFAKCKFAKTKIFEWTKRKPEFEKRSGFTIMAAYCMADKVSENDVFEQFLPIIKREVEDDRVYVKKAVNWALRNIGKRNIDLKQAAICISNEILQNSNPTAQWIAKNALKELTKKDVRMSDYPRSQYRIS